MLRVGGVRDHEKKLEFGSTYAWFEPLLVAGTHYVRTDINGLSRAVDDIASRPDAALRKIASRGASAYRALVSKRGLKCYTTLAVDTYVRAIPKYNLGSCH